MQTPSVYGYFRAELQQNVCHGLHLAKGVPYSSNKRTIFWRDHHHRQLRNKKTTRNSSYTGFRASFNFTTFLNLSTYLSGKFITLKFHQPAILRHLLNLFTQNKRHTPQQLYHPQNICPIIQIRSNQILQARGHMWAMGDASRSFKLYGSRPHSIRYRFGLYVGVSPPSNSISFADFWRGFLPRFGPLSTASNGFIINDPAESSIQKHLQLLWYCWWTKSETTAWDG